MLGRRYTPLYEKGIKKTKNKSMETTSVVKKVLLIKLWGQKFFVWGLRPSYTLNVHHIRHWYCSSSLCSIILQSLLLLCIYTCQHFDCVTSSHHNLVQNFWELECSVHSLSHMLLDHNFYSKVRQLILNKGNGFPTKQ